MLTPAERIAFILLVLVCGAVAARGFAGILGVVRRGRPAARSDRLVARFVGALVDVGMQRPIFKARPVVSVFHAFIFFGFSFYLLVNVTDVLEAYVAGWHTLGGGPIAQGFNLFADLFSVLVLLGMVFFLVRRFGLKPAVLAYRPSVKLHPGVAAGGVRRDSLVVGTFILLHVGGRFTGTAFHLAQTGQGDPFLPAASVVSLLLRGMTPEALEAGVHVTWWLAMGLIVLFLPYFPYSKHIHLMIAPVNLALGRRTPRGRMDDAAPAEGSSPGAGTLTELPWPQVLDAYACIMCNRCQEVCPAYASGTPLSPAALEVNKRYHVNAQGRAAAAGQDGAALLDFAIRDDAVWSCTTCYACVRVCPVGNEPLMDILELRRRLVFEAKLPDGLSDALRNLDEQGNSFGESARKRSQWGKDLGFEIKDPAQEPVDYLWYVGDFASFNPNCQDVSRKVARVFQAAGLDFGVIKRGEQSAGNDVRRVGEEGLFESLAEKNIKTLSGCQFKRIVTTDPHTFNALKNEYPKFGATYDVQHYSTVLLELVRSGRIRLKKRLQGRATYHDPCYLGRYNGVFDAPRELIRLCGLELVEMPRNRENSFCCGAGGGRIWMKDHPDTTQRPSENRIQEAAGLNGVSYFTVACPKDMTLYSDAVKTAGQEGKMAVRDLVDFVIEAMDLDSAQPSQSA
jgi:Fe-S oxidoreductase